jgi:hypothetical protein
LSSLLALVLLSGDGVPVAASQLACVVRTVSVAHVMRVPHVMAAELFLLLVFVDPNACVVGDQGHDFAQSAWCFLFGGSHGFMVAFVVLASQRSTHLQQ